MNSRSRINRASRDRRRSTKATYVTARKMRDEGFDDDLAQIRRFDQLVKESLKVPEEALKQIISR